ncbi:hypothetical protein EDD18DRAFT_738158 [Armillaria luteobubalina]|uniref:DUF5648 domain-containing protein n=1 Tax=Armillaria luteobubalina TaxID=153913 RepID=A0AA39QH57_9AGAR|nr:hypothetical protein EDD18DRAFT_738158 [Armillaria luteobubalina]
MPPESIAFVALGVVSATQVIHLSFRSCSSTIDAQNHTCLQGHAISPPRIQRRELHDYFYTTSAVEMENAIMQYKFNSEGDAALVFGSQALGTVPLYRIALFHRGVDHFYTANENERSNVVKNLGHKDEGIVGYIYPSAVCCSVPFYRLYNPRMDDHFYTANKSEKSIAAQTLGCVTEGIAGYVLPV